MKRKEPTKTQDPTADPKPAPRGPQLKRLRVDQRVSYQIYLYQRMENGVPVQNGGKYVGRTKNPKRRHKKHRKAKRTTSFHEALRIHGYSSFKLDVLDTVWEADEETAYAKARVREDYFIRRLDTVENGYNARYEIGSGTSADIEFYKANYRLLNPHACPHCTARWRKKYRLKEHIYKRHGGDPPFACNECGRGFGRKTVLSQHMRTHTGEKPHVCKECGRSFAALGNLKVHTQMHNGEKPHVCDECGSAFTQSGNLKRHIRTHTGEKPYVCDECGRAFAETGKLKIHTRIHTGEKPYVCDECGRVFAETGNLKIHTRTHTGEKPYVCDECCKDFADPSAFKRHMRTHTGEKPYVCEKCGKAFSQSITLTRHIRTHTGEKPHVCKDCGKGFAQLANLKRHFLRSHPVRCRFCQKPFATDDKRREHEISAEGCWMLLP